MWIYDAGNIIGECGSKQERARRAQAEVDRLKKGTCILVHYGVERGGEREMCEGVYMTSKGK